MKLLILSSLTIIVCLLNSVSGRDNKLLEALIRRELDEFSSHEDEINKRQYDPTNDYSYDIGNRAVPTIPRNLPVCTGGFAIDTSGTTFCLQDSSGKRRAVYEVDCVFPFIYKGVWYDKCTKKDSTYYWCSLDSEYRSRIAYCEQECPILARKLTQNVGATHTACSPANIKAVGYFPDQAQIKMILDVHNNLRSTVYPSAADMRIVTWDNGLARLAQRRAETCLFSHDCSQCRKLINNQTIEVGQNAYYSFNINYNPNSFWNNAIGAWGDEKKFFTYGSNSESVGHYTQIVNSDVGRVGCGMAVCDASIYAYCNYASGQTTYDTPYTPGISCSSCPPGMCFNNLCVCTKFCQNEGTLDPLTCSCKCPPYALGTECEILSCSKSDKDYGCWTTNPYDCMYSNIPPICPNMCGLCQIN